MAARLLVSLLVLAVSGCLKKEDPQVCYQRHITEHPNRNDYEYCMREYRIRAGLASFEEREAREREIRDRQDAEGRRWARALSGMANDDNGGPCRQWSCQQRFNREECTCLRY